MSIDPQSDYYDVGGIETREIVKAKISGVVDPVEAFYRGNILKYDCRGPYKGCAIRDCEKAIIYNKMLLELLKEKEADTKERWNKSLSNLNDAIKIGSGGAP